MPLPLLILIPAILAGGAGIGAGIHGGLKMHRASKRIKEAQVKDKGNLERLESSNIACSEAMDRLGTHEMEILASFDEFSDLFERIHNRPNFAELKIGSLTVPKFNKEEIENASVGANILLGSLGAATLGTAGAFAASGATTAAVAALGTASTGTLISSLSGAAATNATLAALGGGSLAAGGGGMALGSAVLGTATLGVSLLVGGIILDMCASSLEGKADKTIEAMQENERQINKICRYLGRLKPIAKKYDSVLMQVNGIYRNKLAALRSILEKCPQKTVSWHELSATEKTTVQNLVLLVGLLYNMCKVQLVKHESCNGLNIINQDEIDKALEQASSVL